MCVRKRGRKEEIRKVPDRQEGTKTSTMLAILIIFANHNWKLQNLTDVIWYILATRKKNLFLKQTKKKLCLSQASKHEQEVKGEEKKK